MKITHIINNQSISKEVSRNATLLTANNLGGYLWLGNDNYSSRYQGWHVRLKGEIYKILDEIRINPQEKTRELKNVWLKETNYLQRQKGEIIETYYMPKRQNTLIYKLSQIKNIELILDIRKSYSSPQQERYYNIYEKGNFLIIKYHNKELNQPLFLAIFTPSLKKWEKIEKWTKKEGIFDRKRHSPPYEAYVYHALNLETNKLIMGAGLSEKAAICNASSLLSSQGESLLSNKRTVFSSVPCSAFPSSVKVLPDVRRGGSSVSRSLVRQSLKNFLVYNKNGKILGLYAGFPWFFQFWLRDTAISLKTLFQIDVKIADEILKKRLFSKEKSFRISNLSLSTLDGMQWALYRFLEVNLFRRKTLGVEEERLSAETLVQAGSDGKHRVLRKTDEVILIQKLLKNFLTHNKNGLIANSSSPTWMDSIKRSQFPIEMQALQLAIYNLAYKITKETKYKNMEKQLKNKVRSYFWNGKMLADGKNDWTIRPNIFLAYYIYPGLLKKSEWETCFKTALKALWLNWGGLSTIDKNSSFYYAKHSGESPKTYHQGDAWFWINNIAAISMIRLNKKKYLSKIKKILNASTDDLLWHGAIGHSSELSSAQKFSPAGSISQAWSSATYLELCETLNKRGK